MASAFITACPSHLFSFSVPPDGRWQVPDSGLRSAEPGEQELFDLNYHQRPVICYLSYRPLS
jgi:hypothetical protein